MNTTYRKMNVPQMNFNSFAAVLSSAAYAAKYVYFTVKQSVALLLSDKLFIATGLATSGFVQVIIRNADIAIDFMAAVFFSFISMMLIGVIKHYKLNEESGKEFLFKTIIEGGTVIVVLALGYGAAIFFDVINRIAGEFLKEPPISNRASNYFIYSAFVSIFIYHFIRAVNMVNQVAPALIPSKWLRFFKSFQQSGKISDLTDISEDEEPKAKPNTP